LALIVIDFGLTSFALGRVMVRMPFSNHSQEGLVKMTLALIEAGFIDQLLLSQDAGWYDPSGLNSLPGNGYRDYTALVLKLIPELLKRGIREGKIQQITVHNPARDSPSKGGKR
jgi:predicted metal-dependent phosphotriesterase family hydrolase